MAHINRTEALTGAAEAASHLGSEFAGAVGSSGGGGGVREQTSGMLDTAKGYITDNPWLAAGIAVGVGAVIGLMLPRRRS
jgi:ElaB/YqjD/DUF883 family membrane-anchored ribosome-binding protein